ncbi:hypothetical protein V144x_10130 [Gimesia aquarii]|uniref:Uncharacterized protein n=1 Tax=Gimesia aquarii TaxID=2527964 RepID=A0A517VRC3_9PLAN|nr:hypothetical protein V144x_10130 [Gimesia aquarii]
MEYFAKGLMICTLLSVCEKYLGAVSEYLNEEINIES